MDIVLLIAGLALILAGANYLTEGASDLAKRLHVSDFVIGLTVVAIGTSTPELVVSLLSVMRGSGELAVGNVVGSNLFNTWMIVGITALITPLKLSGSNVRIDIPFGFLATVVFWICASDTILGAGTTNMISRSEGLLMLCFFVIFLFYTLLSAKSDAAIVKEETETGAGTAGRALWLSLVMVIGGLAGLVYGGDLFLDHAIVLARRWGMSEAVIGVTLVAAGTSLPELAASVVAALKGKAGIALGNILGSNVLNIFLVLGASATVGKLSMGDVLPVDVLVVMVSALMLFLTAFTVKKREVDRWEGGLFVLLYMAYIVWVILR